MLIYYLTINVITLALWGADKLRARAGAWRVAERTLLALAFLGGAFGALAGMLLFRHKTRKPKFWAGVGAACVLHALLILFFG